MKKSTGVVVLLSLLVGFVIVAGVIVTILAFLLQGSTPAIFSSNRIALVRVTGVIYDAQDWIDEVEDFAEDSSVKGIVLRVDSPGGAVGPSQDLYDAVMEARKEHGKIVVASFGSVAASGGYYIACGADRIVSSPGAMTGSIGVYAKFLQAKDLMEKIGVNYETIKAGEYKNMGAMERGMTEKERDMMQHVIDDTYMQFIEAVIDGRQHAFKSMLNTWEPKDDTEWYPFTADIRKIIRDYQEQKEYLRELAEAKSKSAAEEQAIAAIADSTAAEVKTNGVESAGEKIDSNSGKAMFGPSNETLIALAKQLADGKIYTGRQAKEVYLVDEIGGLDDAIDLAGRLAGIRGEVTVVEKRKREPTWLDLLSEKMSLLSQAKNESPLLYLFPY